MKKRKPKKSHVMTAIRLGTIRKEVMCKRKKSFVKHEAEDIAVIYNQRTYECPICGNYHLTSNK